MNMKRWFYLVQSIVLMLCYGTVYSWSIFRIPVEESYGIGSTLSGMPYMIFLLVYALSMVVGGKLIKRYTPRHLLITGGILISIGWIASSFTSSIIILTLTYGVLIGFGVGISYGVPIVVIAEWFPLKKGILVGIVLAGFGLSPLITAPLGHWMIKSQGLSSTFLIYGVIFGIIIPLLSMTIKTPKAKEKTTTLVEETETQLKMTKQKSFIYVYASFFIGTMIGLTIIGLTNNVGNELVKIDSTGIAVMMTIFAVFNGLGRPLFGWLTEKHSPGFAMTTSFLLIMVASVLMLFSGEGTVALYLISFSILWLNLGAWLAIAPMTTMTLYGMKSYSMNYGVMFTAYGFGAVIGVISTGLLIDYLKNYKAIFVFVIALTMIGLLTSGKLRLLMRSKIHVELYGQET